MSETRTEVDNGRRLEYVWRDPETPDRFVAVAISESTEYRQILSPAGSRVNAQRRALILSRGCDHFRRLLPERRVFEHGSDKYVRNYGGIIMFGARVKGCRSS